MSKRVPTDELDKNIDDLPQNGSVLVDATDDQIKDRQILKLKKPEQKEVSNAKPVQGFVFEKAEVKDSATTEGQNHATDNKDSKPLFDIKPPSADNMFSGAIKLDEKKINTNLFFTNNNQNPKDDKVENDSSKNHDKNDNEEKKGEETNKTEDKVNGTSNHNNESNSDANKKTGLFEGNGLFSQNKTSSLFAPNPNPLAGTNQPSLFGNNQVPLFSNVEHSIFSQGSKLFGATEQKTSIFSNVGTGFFQNVVKDEDEEGDEGDDEPQEEEPEESQEDFAEKLKQDPNSNTIFIKACKNFKVDDNEALGIGFVSIEQPKENDKVFFLIFRNKTKRILHNSLVVPKISNSVFMKGKKTAMTILTLGTKKDESSGSFPKYYVKVGFETEEDAGNFKSEIEKIYNS